MSTFLTGSQVDNEEKKFRCSQKAFRLHVKSEGKIKKKKDVPTSKDSNNNFSFSRKHKKTLTIPKIQTFKKLKSLKNEYIKQTLNNFNIKPPLDLSFTITNDNPKEHSKPKPKGNYIYKNYRNKIPRPVLANTLENQNHTTCNTEMKEMNEEEIKKYFMKYNKAESLYKELGIRRFDYLNQIKNRCNSEKKLSTLKIKSRPNTPNNFKLFNTVFKDTLYDTHINLNDCNFKTKTANQRYKKNMESLLYLKNIVINAKNYDEKKQYIISYLNTEGIFDINEMTDDKIKNFINYITTDFIINPKILFKEVLTNILNNRPNIIKQNNKPKYLTNIKTIIPHKIDSKEEIRAKIVNNLVLHQYPFLNNEIERIDIKNFPLRTCETLSKSIDELDSDLRKKIKSNYEDESTLTKKDIIEIKKQGKLLEVVCFQHAKERINLLKTHNQTIN